MAGGLGVGRFGAALGSNLRIGIIARSNNTAFQAFNPFTTAPAQPANWDYSPTFGQPEAFDDYQQARVFSFSAGVRF